MVNVFESSFSTLDWAREQIQDLQNRIGLFEAVAPYKCVAEVDGQVADRLLHKINLLPSRPCDCTTSIVALSRAYLLARRWTGMFRRGAG
jgi:hypothetical protein